MTELAALNNYFIQFGTGLCLLLVGIELVKKEPGKPLGELSLVVLCLASIQARIGFFLNEVIISHPRTAILLVTSIYAMGPLILALASKMLDFALEKRGRLGWHFIPVIFVAAFDLYLTAFQSTEELRQTIIESLSKPQLDLVNVGIGFGIAHVVAYFGYIILLTMRLRTRYEVSYTKLVWTILITPLTGIALLSLGLVLTNKVVMHIGGGLLTITISFFYLFTARHPHFFETLRSDIKQKRYENTQLTGINLDVVRSRMLELFGENKIYLDENLRLNDLAEELLVTPHQLSRILNEHYGKNFNEFVNEYRVQEAKDLLVSEPDRSVLSIAYQVGFNTKTTFNSQFLRITGKTPVDFRRQPK